MGGPTIASEKSLRTEPLRLHVLRVTDEARVEWLAAAETGVGGRVPQRNTPVWPSE